MDGAASSPAPPALAPGLSADSATSRFFQSKGLLSLLMTYLSLERVDLLSLAAVSKPVREQALKAWARHLDLRLSTAHKFLRLYEANPALAASVRFLRIRNDIAERIYSFGDLTTAVATQWIDTPEPQWEAVSSILALIAYSASQPGNTPPFIDAKIGLTEAPRLLQLLTATPVLAHGLVGLRVISDVELCTESEKEPGADLFDDDDREPVNAMNLPSVAEYMATWEQNWDALIEILVMTQSSDGQEPGLLAFQFHHEDKIYEKDAPWESRWKAPAVPQRFWDALNTASRRSLQDLGLILAGADDFNEVLKRLKHAAIKTLFLKLKIAEGGEHGCAALDTFLDHNEGLQHLFVDIEGVSSGLSFRQSFPQLRWLDISFNRDRPSPSDPRFMAFARRHPHLEATSTKAREREDAFPGGIFPQLRDIVGTSAAMAEHSARGGQLRHLQVDPSYRELMAEGRRHHVPGTLDSKLWAQNVTGLKLFLGFSTLVDVIPAFKTSLGAENMPHLVELDLLYYNTGMPDRGAKKDIRRAIAALACAPKLQVLQFQQQTHNAGEDRMLTRPLSPFPPSLKYFIWVEGAIGRTSHFRVHPRASRTKADGEKEGQLQPISPMFRTQISSAGLWNHSFHDFSGRVVLDHSIQPPPIRAK
ncbi:hypothetical protein OC834_006624 [Tilletia horrida]|nr:hypothetical protein OC834_006624 [Tilletia horrida]KAK0536201.1 hypothetical protein OC835_002099 [Tilletia horrida]KAK0565666.1 hypothetical protein OC844_001104 [Tilletia horrida]